MVPKQAFYEKRAFARLMGLTGLIGRAEKCRKGVVKVELLGSGHWAAVKACVCCVKNVLAFITLLIAT